MLNLHLPDLTFPMMKYGRIETPIDLRILLYKGGAKALHSAVFNQIDQGKFGSPIVGRILLVTRIHEVLTARLVAGGSKSTVSTNVRLLRDFFAWAENSDHALSLETVETIYRHWCDSMLHLMRHNKLIHKTAYVRASVISKILDDVLNRQTPLIKSTPIRSPKQGKRAVGISADKQNLADTFSFGRLCLDVIDSLSFETTFGPLPAKIRLRDGSVFEEWSGLCDPATCTTLQPGYRIKAQREKTLRTRANWEADGTLRTRYPLVNLRILCEMSAFMTQTGMNLAQVNSLRRTQFRYKSMIDGYEVLTYKNRRKGEVLFEIFAEYKGHFERYLTWRDKVFAGDQTNLLFPYVRKLGRDESDAPDFTKLRVFCTKAGFPFIGSRNLRKTRLNWLLRQSRNPELTAEQAQHTKETLFRIYEKPSLQVAMSEITKFWKRNDPTLVGNPMPCPAPGVCDGTPKPKSDLPPEAPKPDCTHPAGCLFCEHHRDIDSADYVWSVASMRHLNTVILQRFRPVSKGKADAARHVELAIVILAAKLKWYKESNAKRKEWVKEAMEKLAEGDFHFHWRYLIESTEGV